MQVLDQHPAAAGRQQPQRQVPFGQSARPSSANRKVACAKAKAKAANSGVPKQTKKRRRKQFEDGKAAQAPPATEAARPAEVTVATVRLQHDPLAVPTGRTHPNRECRKMST